MPGQNRHMTETTSEKAQEKQSWPQLVAAAIDTLIGAARITWGGDDGWRYEHAVALKDLTLTSTDEPWVLAEGEQVYVDTRRSTGPVYTLWDHKVVPATHVTLDIPPGKSEPEKQTRPDASYRSEPVYFGTMRQEFRHEAPPPVTIRKNGAAFLASDPAPSASEYTVREKMNGLFEATVPASSVQIRAFGTSVPDHRTAPLRLMCFELFPYAAVHGGHMKPGTFFKGVANRTAKKVDGSVSWAGFLGADMTKDAQPVDLKATFRRGDIIVFWQQGRMGLPHRDRIRGDQPGRRADGLLDRGWRAGPPCPLGPLGGGHGPRQGRRNGHGHAGAGVHAP